MRMGKRMVLVFVAAIAAVSGGGAAAKARLAQVAPARPPALAFMVLSAHDLEKSKRFYIDGIGLRLARPSVHGSPLGIGLNGGGQPGFDEMVLLVQQIDGSGAKGPIAPADDYKGPIGIRVPDLDAAVRRVKAIGGRILKEAFPGEAGVRKALLIDPDGLIVELLEVAEGR